MTRYRLSPRAQTDLAEIWDYTAERWGAEQAATYIRRIESSVEAAATEPTSGTACDHIRAGYRKLRSGSHVLFYRVGEDGIEVMRILHQRMDFEQHFPS
jgi:toxin ParE1/3/4